MDWRIRFAVLALIWGFSFLLIKVGTHGFAPFQVTFGRLFFGTAIRRDHRAGMKMRELERKYNVSWRTVKKAVDSVWPEPRKKLPPRPTALDPYKTVIDEMLRTDLDAPRKQRHTITRIFHRLVEEHGADVSHQMVRRYVSDRKPEILAASGKAPVEAFVPQTHLPGHEAEVHFGDVTVRLAGLDDGQPQPRHPVPAHESTVRPPTRHAQPTFRADRPETSSRRSAKNAFGSGPLTARDLVRELLHVGGVRVPGKGDVVVHDGRSVAHGQRLSWGESGELGDREAFVCDTAERAAASGLHVEHQDHAWIAVDLSPVDENAERKRPRTQFRIALPCITAHERVRGDAREVGPDAERFPTQVGPVLRRQIVELAQTEQTVELLLPTEHPGPSLTPVPESRPGASPSLRL
ncbi:hypothetical protein ACIOGX_35275 [Streptomyces sp. NPDC088147]|uniref:hypothetical protein n=1 Tax=Streptomyces sp. NPDC088147 TaxID=3365830 RepID=UPI003826A76B